MADTEDSPLITALPPATDYMTYLTILDTHLTKDQLPLLHDLLQDERLTTNIGWDLVHILLPMLPEADQCLQDVALMGNPREVVLKVTELLSELTGKAHAIAEASDTEEDEEDEEDSNDQHDSIANSKQTQEYKTLCAHFQCLLHMLCVLHPRIKTKLPSRFLLTSLQAILPAYKALAQFQTATRSVLMFLKSMSGSKRPNLPPRGTEESVPTVTSLGSKGDPEADQVPEDAEKEIQKTLLRCLATQVSKLCVESFESIEGTSGLAWTERYYEKIHPDKLIPGRQTYRQLFDATEELTARDALMSQLWNTIAFDLSTSISSLAALALPSSTSTTPTGFTSPDFPPSNVGALYLLTNQTHLSLLSSRPLTTVLDHQDLLQSYLGAPTPTSPGAALVPAALVDALLLLGWAWLQNGGQYPDSAPHKTPESEASREPQEPQEPPNPQEPSLNPTSPNTTNSTFNQHLQSLTLASATCSYSSLRNQAAELSGALLSSHPSPLARKSFLTDTLEHCPYEGVKACAVGWVKGEFVRAWGAGDKGGGAEKQETGTEKKEVGAEKKGSEDEVWGPTGGQDTLKDLAPILWPSVVGLDAEELMLNVPFFLAGLNLLYLLCKAAELRAGLGVDGIVKKTGVEGFVSGLEGIVRRLRDDGSGEGGERDLMLLESAVDRAREGMHGLGG